MKKLFITVEKTETGYSAYSEKYPVYTTGGDVAQLAANIVEAFNFYFAENGENLSVSSHDISLKFSIPSLFDLYPINVKHFAARIGMNYTLLSQYVQGRKKPSAKQAAKIVRGLHEVGEELRQVTLI